MIAAPDPHKVDPHQALAAVIAQDRGRLIAALAAQLRDVDLAEEVLGDAIESALIHWRRSGVPSKPQGWLLVVAKRKALDRLRRKRRFVDGPAQVARLLHEEAQGAEIPDIPDERLRLIFACCHPALDGKSRVALTLRLLGGLTTGAIARAFLDTETTMGQRISRAKAKIAAAGIPFVVPGPQDWAERLGAVLDVITLIFNAGYVPPEGNDPGRDLCEEAVFLGRLLVQMTPNDPETEGALALLLFLHARRNARRGAEGTAVALEDQEIGLWDAALIAEARALLDRAMQRRASGPFQIKAALQALHIDGRLTPPTDWRQVFMLYTGLLRFEDTPVVRLNRAVALAEAGALDHALQLLQAMAADLATYQPFHAALADLQARAGQPTLARAAYDRAILLSEGDADRAFLRARRSLL